jgi:hypothetical protein
MAGITQAMATSFKVELMDAYHNFGTAPTRGTSAADTFKIALFKGTVTGTYSAATTNYSDMTGNTDETTGTGYTAGGNTLTISNVPTSGASPLTTAWLSFSNTSWTTATISSSGAMIYNSTQGNRCVCVLSFGGIVSSTAGTFTIQFPTAAASTAIIQIQ